MIKTILKRVLLVIGIILVWSFCSRNANPLFVPQPKVVFWDLIETIKSGQLLIAIVYSFLRITIATCLSGLIAFPIALLVYNSKIAKEILCFYQMMSWRILIRRFKL